MFDGAEGSGSGTLVSLIGNGLPDLVTIMKDARHPDADWQVWITTLASRLGFTKEDVQSVSSAVIDNAWFIVSTIGKETGVHHNGSACDTSEAQEKRHRRSITSHKYCIYL